MRVTYDESADAAYTQLVDDIGAGGVAHTAPGDPEFAYGINLDLDHDGRLVGVEVLDASRQLPEAFLPRFANRTAEPT